MSEKRRAIIGYGGDDEGGGGSKEAPDSLISLAVGNVLDAVSEGEIEGWITPGDPKQSIYLDGVPVRNVLGADNFKDVTVVYRTGTQGQTHIPGYPSVENEVAVATEVLHGIPIIRSVTDSNIDRVRVLIAIPALSAQDTSTGSINPYTVTIALDLDTGGGFVNKILDVISGKTNTRYQRQYVLELTGSGPWSVRVRRISSDDLTTNVTSRTVWDSYTEIIDSRLSYPNTALVGVSVLAKQFRTIPQRGYGLKLLKVKIPSNYNPVTRVYTGIWDGTFSAPAWTDNPAWCFYDLLTENRYGLGDFIDPASVDKAGLYEIAKYCDQLVPNGKGGLEPRFRINLYLQTREEAFTVVNNFASAFRSMVFYGAGTIQVVQDAPRDPEYIYSNSNVVDGKFTYSGTARLARHTVALVTWNDPEDLYKQKVEYVEDPVGISLLGVRETESVAFGCTSRAQANRWGRWILYSEQAQTEICTFRVSLDSVFAYPGQIIAIHDEDRAGIRFAGRIVSATTTAVTIDAPVIIESGKAYTLKVMLPNGTLAEKNVTNAPGSTSVINLASALSTAPIPSAEWLLASNTLQPQLFRILSISEPEKAIYELSCLEHNIGKYNYVDFGVDLRDPPITTLPVTIAPPATVSLSQYEVTNELAVTIVLVISWTAVNPVFSYRVEYRQDDGNWTRLPNTSHLSVDVPGVTIGRYVARVFSIDDQNRESAATYSAEYVVVNKAAPPAGLSALITTPDIWSIHLRWAFFPNQFDVKKTEIWYHSANDRAGASILTDIAFPTDNYLLRGLALDTTLYFWGRVQNSSGVYSEWYPVSSTGGVQGRTEIDPGKLLEILTGQITESQLWRSLQDRINLIDAPGTGLIDRVAGLTITPTDIAAVVRSALIDIDANAEAIAELLRGNNLLRTDLDLTGFKLAEAQFLLTANTDNNSATAQAITFLVARVDNVVAGLLVEQTARATAIEALASSITTLFGSVGGTTSAAVLNEALIRATADSALASQLSVVQATISGQTVSIATEATVRASQFDGLSAQYTVKIDNNGYVSGFGLASTPVNGVPFSEFYIRADRFAVGSPGVTRTIPFIIQSGTVFMDDIMVRNASITTLKVAGNAVTVPVYIEPSFPSVGSISAPFLTYINDFTEPYPAMIMITWQYINPTPIFGGTATNSLFRDGITLNTETLNSDNGGNIQKRVSFFNDTIPVGESHFNIGNVSALKITNMFILGVKR